MAQVQNGAERVIASASKGLSPAEIRYPAHKLEFLALQWAVTSSITISTATDSDALSRLSNQEVNQVLQTCPQRVSSCETQEPESHPAECATASEEPDPSSSLELSEPYGGVGTEVLPSMTPQEIRAERRGDPRYQPSLALQKP